MGNNYNKRRCSSGRIHPRLAVGRYAIPTLPWLAKNHTAISLLGRSIPVSQGQYRSQRIADYLFCNSAITERHRLSVRLRPHSLKELAALPVPSNWISGGGPGTENELKGRQGQEGRKGEAGKRKHGKGEDNGRGRDTVPYMHFVFPLPVLHKSSVKYTLKFTKSVVRQIKFNSAYRRI